MALLIAVIFSRIVNVIPQNKSYKFKKTEIISSVLPDHNDMKLEINYKKKTGKFINMVIKQHATGTTNASKKKSKEVKKKIP